jgi:hypothetical protein
MGCLSAVAVLVWQTAVTSPGALWVLGAMVVASVTIELGYRVLENRSLSLGPRLPTKPEADAGSTRVSDDG